MAKNDDGNIDDPKPSGSPSHRHGTTYKPDSHPINKLRQKGMSIQFIKDHFKEFDERFDNHSQSMEPSKELPHPSANPESIHSAATHPAAAAGANYEALVSRYQRDQQELKFQFAGRLLPALKDAMRAKPHTTYEEKKDLVKWVNSELRKLDLAFQSPKTGSAAVFKVNPGRDASIGIFQLVGKDSEGKDKTDSATELETLLDKLQLMDAPERRESIMEWQEKIAASKSKRPPRLPG